MAAPARTGSGGGSGGGGGVDLAYLCYQLLGAGCLFPWSALITAADWWNQRYPGKHTDRLLTVAYLPVNLLAVSAMVYWHGRVRPRVRVVGGLLGFTLALSAVVLLDFSEPTAHSLYALLLLVAVCGTCDGILSGALYAEAAALPPRYTQALVSGSAVSGVVVAMLRVATKITLPATPGGLRLSANLYFGVAALVCATCAAVYCFVLPRLSAVRRYKEASLEAALHQYAEVPSRPVSPSPLLPATADRAGSPSPLLPSIAEPAGSTQSSSLKPKALRPGPPNRSPQKRLPAQQRGRTPQTADVELSPRAHLRARCSLDLESVAEEHDHWDHSNWWPQRQHSDEAAAVQSLLQGYHGAVGGGAAGGGGGGAWMDGRQHADPEQQATAAAASHAAVSGTAAVLRRIWRLALGNMLTFIVTLSIFPGVLAEDEHSQRLGSWYPVALITAFMLADWIGKSLPGWARLRLRDASAILSLALLRTLFVPGFRLAALRHATPPLIFLLTLSLGASNGYLCACAMMGGPSSVPPAAAPLASQLMVLFLVLGLCLGGGCSFLWLL